jgi:hypothetical protein
MRITTAILLVAFLSLVREGAARANQEDIPQEAIGVVNPVGAPVRLESVRARVENRQLIVECKLLNAWDEPLVRAEITLAVYDIAGRRRGVQVEDIPASDLPLANDVHSITIEATTVAFNDGDRVRLGISAAGAATRQWGNSDLIAGFDRAFELPELVVLDLDDAPAAILNVQVIRSASGTPVAVLATVKNRLQEPIISYVVEVLLFSEKGMIRSRQFKPVFYIIPVGGSRDEEILITSGAESKSKIAIGLWKAKMPKGQWQNLHTKEQAKAQLMQKPL